MTLLGAIVSVDVDEVVVLRVSITTVLGLLFAAEAACVEFELVTVATEVRVSIETPRVRLKLVAFAVYEIAVGFNRSVARHCCGSVCVM